MRKGVLGFMTWERLFNCGLAGRLETAEKWLVGVSFHPNYPQKREGPGSAVLLEFWDLEA